MPMPLFDVEEHPRKRRTKREVSSRDPEGTSFRHIRLQTSWHIRAKDARLAHPSKGTQVVTARGAKWRFPTDALRSPVFPPLFLLVGEKVRDTQRRARAVQRHGEMVRGVLASSGCPLLLGQNQSGPSPMPLPQSRASCVPLAMNVAG